MGLKLDRFAAIINFVSERDLAIALICLAQRNAGLRINTTEESFTDCEMHIYYHVLMSFMLVGCTSIVQTICQ